MQLDYRTAGDGPPLLLIHGGAEDAAMLSGQAEALATNRRVIWYDRRGTGNSTRADWPGSGADQHADDAAALLRELDAVPATVLGFSSGGVIALALAARHPELVTEVIAWEPAAVSMLPGGEQMRAALQEPYEEHLRRHPGDWRGAYHVLLHTLSQGHADLDSPIVKLAEANAEAVLRDDGPLITGRTFGDGELPAGKVVIALSETPDPLHQAIGNRLAELTGRTPVTVKDADTHEVYLDKPHVIADFLESRCDLADPPSSFARFLTRYETANTAFVNGDASRWLQITAGRDPVSILGGFGGLGEAGTAEVHQRYLLAAGAFQPSGATVDFDYLVKDVRGRIAYTVATESADVLYTGRTEPHRQVLRVTMIFRFDNGAWSLVHRHADTMVALELPAGAR